MDLWSPSAWISAEGLWPTISPEVYSVIRFGYGILLGLYLFTLVSQARRFFLTERYGGYAEHNWKTVVGNNPFLLPWLFVVWFSCALIITLAPINPLPALVINAVLTYYYFISLRWDGLLRGFGAPGFVLYLGGAALMLFELCRQFAPNTLSLCLLTFQVDLACVVILAGISKLFGGYYHGHGMDYGLVNPMWGYFHRLYRHLPTDHFYFRALNFTAWAGQILIGILMVIPSTRFIGGILYFAMFLGAMINIRLGFLGELLLLLTAFFFFPGSAGDQVLKQLTVNAAFIPATPLVGYSSVPAIEAVITICLVLYLFLRPLTAVVLLMNYYRQILLPKPLQTFFQKFANIFGIILWRVFLYDLLNFYIKIEIRTADGERRTVSHYDRPLNLRFNHVGEAILVTTIFTTLKYFPSNRKLFEQKLVRYARTLANDHSEAVFTYVSIVKHQGRFVDSPATEFSVDIRNGTVAETVLDPTINIHEKFATLPKHEGARPGSYAPATT